MVKFIKFVFCYVALSFIFSCEKKDLYGGYFVDELNDITKAYIYPYKNQSQNNVAEITIETDGSVNLNDIQVEIPHLKYNKSFLVMLTQDDCKHAAFSVTWAAIHNKPLSKTTYYYDYVQLRANDLPPDVTSLNKTLGSTDGAGNEVRFSFTTTLAPEWDYMDTKTYVALLPESSNSRFSMKSGLTWRNVIEMMNYDAGIAFHDIKSSFVNIPDTIKKHYEISQDIILNKLSGRGCKVLAEPNGNKAYIEAARTYASIQAITAQAQAESIKPHQEERDLHGIVQERWFIEPEVVKQRIAETLALPQNENHVIHIGVHGTDTRWVNLLVWLNDTYGKDGSDQVWMPSMEEYYEYNYNRVNGTVEKTIEGNKLKVKITLPGDQYFYFPSTTVNLKGLTKENVLSVSSNNTVTGMSYNDYDNGFMVNIDCRSSLAEHAEHYIEEYRNYKDVDPTLKDDALYFIHRLKESDQKTALLKQIQ